MTKLLVAGVGNLSVHVIGQDDWPVVELIKTPEGNHDIYVPRLLATRRVVLDEANHEIAETEHFNYGEKVLKPSSATSTIHWQLFNVNSFFRMVEDPESATDSVFLQSAYLATPTGIAVFHSYAAVKHEVPLSSIKINDGHIRIIHLAAEQLASEKLPRLATASVRTAGGR